MNKVFLNKIILDISDKAAANAFTSACDESIRDRIQVYSGDMHEHPDSLYLSDSVTNCKAFTKIGYPACAVVHDNNKDNDFSGIRYVIEQPELISLEDYENIYRRLSGLPLDILSTDRLFIRETSTGDLDRFYDLYDDPEVKSFMEPLFEPDKELEYQLNYIDSIYGFFDIGMWTVLLKGTDTLIGRAGIEYTDEPGCVELGFMIGAAHRKKGYAYEACSAVIEYARGIEAVNKVRARVRKDNTASQNLCRKLGLQPVRDLDEGLVEWTLELKPGKNN